MVGALAGCPADGPTFNPDGGRDARAGEGGADSGTCQLGQWYCINGGTQARQCDGRGGYSAQADCSAMGQTCVPVLGCAVCRPGEHRCNADNPDQTEQCSDDGSAWLPGAVCNSAAGQMCSAGLCADRCSSGELTYLGCEYWPTITANSQLDEIFPFAVVVANPQTYPVTMNITGGALRSAMSRTLAPNEVATIQLPSVPTLIQNAASSGTTINIAHSVLVQNGAYHLQANGPIAAYQFNPLTYEARSGGSNVYSYTNDASLLLPTHVLTTNYIVGTHNNWPARDTTNTIRAVLGGFVAIVGVDPAEEGTTVTVRLSAAISAGSGVTAAAAGTTQTYNLRQGDVVQLVGSMNGQDLTGTIIDSNHAVAVFVGNDCTNIPEARPACDHLEEQLLPAATWGRHYAVSQLRLRGAAEPHIVRLIAQRDGASYTFDGIAAPAACNGSHTRGQACEFSTTGNFQVSGSQPFLVLQFMQGQGEPDPSCVDFLGNPINTNDPICMGDPASVTEIPVEQFRLSYDFLVPSTYARNMVNVVAPTGAPITLDGVTLNGSSVAIGAGYSVTFVPIMEGRHHIETTGDANRFGIKVYGIASYTSYMYPGGLDLDQISPPG